MDFGLDRTSVHKELRHAVMYEVGLLLAASPLQVATATTAHHGLQLQFLRFEGVGGTTAVTLLVNMTESHAVGYLIFLQLILNCIFSLGQ